MRLRVLVVVAFAILLVLPRAVLAMPPSPELLARAAKDPALATQIARSQAAASAAGVDKAAGESLVVVPDALGVPSVMVDAVAAPAGTLRTLAILVDFSDSTGTVAPTSFDNLLFADVFGPSSLRGYYREVSNGTPSTKGQLDVVTSNLPSTVGWVRLPRPKSYYVSGGNYGAGTYPNNCQKMVEDAVAALNPFIDFSQYDNDHDGYVDNLIVIHAGQGADFTGSTSDIWSHSWSTMTYPLVDGVRVGSYTTEPEYWMTKGDMTVGVFAHEMGHTLGLPDLYDTTYVSPGVYSSAGIGNWSLMAGGSWNGTFGDSPARPDAWCAAKLGWLDPVTITGPMQSRTLPVVSSTSTAAFKMYPGSATTGSQYFLVENRQRTGTDSGLPGAGLLVWHVDETVSNNDVPAHKLVDLEEASGPQDMDLSTGGRGGAEDPFPGTSVKRTFSDTTTPDARTYAAAASGLRIDAISDSVATMTADIGFGSMSVNNGASYATTTSVTVNSNVPWAGQMRVNPGSGFGAWVTYQSSRAAVLTSGDGVKTVIAEYRESSTSTPAVTLSDTIVLDTTAPSLGTITSPTHSVEASWYAAPSASLAWSAADANGVTGYSYQLDDSPATVPDAVLDSVLSTATYSALPDGVYYFHVRAQDVVGNWSAASHRAVRIDTTAPAGTIALPAAVGAASVTATLSATDISPVTMRFSVDGGATSTAEPFSATKTLNLPGSDGTKTVTATFTDAAGNTSASSGQVYLDTASPTGAITLAGGAAYTATTSVDATLSASDAAAVRMRLSVDGGAHWSAWTAFADSAQLSFAPGDGTKTGSAEFQDALGHVTADSDTIVLDTTAPTVGSDAVASYKDQAVINITGADAGSGFKELRYRVDGGATVTVRAATAAVTVTGNSSHTLDFVAEDNAGNLSDAGHAEFVITAIEPPVTPPPTPRSVERVQGALRYDVAANLARRGWDPAGDGSWPGVRHLIVASGEDKAAADPLSAAGLAGVYDAPILLVRSGTKNSIPAATAQVIAQVAAANPGVQIHVVGGPASVAEKTVTKLLAISGNVSRTRDRVSGRDRYAVTANIADRMADVVGPDGIPGVLVVCAEKPAAFYDALAASPAAYRAHMPMLGVRAGSVPASVASVLARRFAGKARYVVSSTAFVSDRVRAGTGASERLATQSDRYAAARQIAEASIARGWSSPADTGLAAKLPDALTGGAFLGKRGGVMLFTDSTTALRPEPTDFIRAHSGVILRGWVFGGTVSMTPQSEAAFRSMLP